MKQTVEEAVRGYRGFMVKDNGGSQYDFTIEDIENAFIVGAEWQVKQSPWISIEEGFPKEDGYYIVTDGNIITIAYCFKGWKKFAKYKNYPHPFYEEGVITAYIPIPPFNPSKPIKMYHDE